MVFHDLKASKAETVNATKYLRKFVRQTNTGLSDRESEQRPVHTPRNLKRLQILFTNHYVNLGLMSLSFFLTFLLINRPKVRLQLPCMQVTLGHRLDLKIAHHHLNASWGSKIEVRLAKSP